MSDSVTEEEVDNLVREALAVSSQLQVSSDSANSLLARLADLKIIRQLAGESQKLQSIGPFEFIEEIGRGGMGAVYKARHRQLGKIQAVKVIHTDGTSNPELLARFKREVRAIGSLSHPNIIAAHHADVENGSPYLVMDYVEGDSLSNIQKNLKSSGKQISVAAACEVIRQASLGIQYAHEQEITHRDIKPGNMVLDLHGVVRVLDLGLAQLRGQETETEVTELTRGDQILGTPDFMSPEQLRSTRSVDSRTDIYSLGATLYVLLTGSTPYPSEPGEGFIAKANRILNAPVPDARKLRPEIPKQLAQIVSKCLQKSADKRFQTAGELAQALETWSNAEELDELQPRLSGASVRKSQSPKSTLKAALPSAKRRLPPRNVWIAIVGGLFLLPVLAGILIRLTIPGVGELIVESSDPNVTVLLRQVDGQGSQTLQVQQGPNKPTSIKVGDWDIEIQGVDASKLVVTPSRVEIGRGQPTVVRIERKQSDAIVESASRNSALADKRSESTTPSIQQPNADALQLSLAPALNEMERSWTLGDVNRVRRGLIAQPAKIDPLFDWQMELIRYPSGATDDEHPYRRHLDPLGNLVAWTVIDHVIVAETGSGQVKQVIQPPAANLLWESVRFSPSGDYLALVSQYALIVEIRTRSGQLLHRWNTTDHSAPGNVDWLPSEKQIVMVSNSKIAMFDLAGKLLAEKRFDKEFKWVANTTVAKNQKSVLFMGSDGAVRQWLPASNELSQVLQIPNFNEGSLAGFSLSHDGAHLLTWDSSNRSRLWRSDGTQVADCEGMLRRASWAPSGRFLVADNRTIFDAQTLREVKRLELAADDALRDCLFDPYWLPDDQITLLSQSVGRISTAGAIRRFLPSGRQLASPALPQLLTPGSASFDQQGLLNAVHASSAKPAALTRWNADGTLNKLLWTEARSVHVDSTNVAWNADATRILLLDRDQAGRIVDTQGKTLRTVPNGKCWNPMWNPSGTQFAVIQYPDSSGQLHVFGEGDVPEWSSPKFSPYIPPPSWSPNGRWLAWVTNDPATHQHWLHVVDLADAQKSVHDVQLIEQGNDRVIAFSSDSQWLVALRQDSTSPAAQGEVLAVHLPSFRELRKSIEVDALHARAVVWAEDSRTFLAGGLMQLSMDDGLQRMGSFNYLGLPNHFFLLRSSSFIASQNGRGYLQVIDGSVSKEFGLPSTAFFGHADRFQAKLTAGDRVALIGAGVDTKPNSIGEFDAALASVRWTGLVFDDGQTLSFNAAGAVLQAPAELDRYVAHTIHYPGGTTVAVTRDELHRRVKATDGQKALLWAMDVFAKVYNSTEAMALSLDSLSIEQLPDVGSISRIDLSDLQEIDEQELEQLAKFTNLMRLDLCRSPIQTLPNLSGLMQLETIDASESSLMDIHGLEGLTALKQLDLSQSKLTVTSSVIEELLPLSGLQHLSLNNLKFEPFTALELGGLKELRVLSLIGVEIPDADLQQLQKALPTCEILTDEKDRDRSRIAAIAE